MKSISQFLQGVLLAASVAFCGGASASVDTIASIVPASASSQLGATFGLTVNIADVADLFAYNLSLNYDPTKVQFISVSEGGFLSNVNTTFFIEGVDNGVGRVEFSGTSLLGGDVGATGSGSLLEFLFKASGAGNAAFSLTDAQFLDSAFNELTVSLGSAVVAVNAVPEPSGATLLLVAALALLLARPGMAARFGAGSRR